MSDSEQQDIIPSAQPVAPPTQPGTITAPQRPPNWPAVIGIIAIVFGCFGILGGCAGILSPFTTQMFSGFMPAGQQEALEQSVALNVIYGIGGLFVATVLLLGGIRLRARRRQALLLIRTWAVVKPVLSVGGAVLGYQSMQHQMEAMQNDPNVAAMGTGILSTFGLVGMVIGLLWTCALPIFMLTWFSREKIKSDTEGWS